MNQDLINRYQPGGDIYNSLAASLGVPGANLVATAALTGDETQVNTALTQAQFGNPLDTSTISIFSSEIATNPLAAPFSDLNTLLSNSLKSLVGNPLVLLSTIAIVGGVVIYFVGIEKLKKLVK
jgi:hypothetical protein